MPIITDELTIEANCMDPEQTGITDELTIEANCVDPEQTAPIVWSGSTLFAIETS